MFMNSAATAADVVFTPPTGGGAYYRSFAADTDSIFIIRELQSFLTVENYNGLELQLGTSAYERAEAYLLAASATRMLLKPEFTPDGEGGIDIEWENNGRHLALSIRPAGVEPEFISWREPHCRYEGAPATVELFQTRLDWLNHD